MAEDLLEAERIPAVHDVLRRKGVAQRVGRDADTLDAGLSAQAVELFAEQVAASPTAEATTLLKAWFTPQPRRRPEAQRTSWSSACQAGPRTSMRLAVTETFQRAGDV